MKINIGEIKAGVYKLSKAIWKFDSLILDENSVLNEKEIKKLEKWSIYIVDVISNNEIKGKIIDIISADFIEEKFLYEKGVTDVVNEESINLLKKIKIDRISSIRELENIKFEIDIEKCITPNNLYLKNKVELYETYCEEDIFESNQNLIEFLKESFDLIKNYEKIDILTLKKFVTLKINENDKFPEEFFKSIYLNKSENFLYSHSVNVMILSIIISKKMGFNKNKMAELAISALLHDVGMSRIEEEFYINKKTFNFNDYFEIFKHPILGADYLTLGLKSRFGGLITLGIYQHHERIDGSGYPRGRTGKTICEYGRIIAVCDVFEAMINDRKYRNAFSSSEAFTYIFENYGILFDERVVDTFLEILINYRIIKREDFQKNEEKKTIVLIADKSPFNMWYICHLLKENHINSVSINSSHKIIEKIIKIIPNLILIDGSISKENGIDILKLINSEKCLSDIFLIYASNSGNKKEVMEALSVGIKDYLKKPYTFDFVINRLLKLLNK